jgi:tRNA dimethylallyltransferase
MTASTQKDGAALVQSLGPLPLMVIAGPTAVGKSQLAIALAKRVAGEIISCDSAQVYRGLDIGSAKVRPEEMDGIPHHLLDVVGPEERFTVKDYQQQATEAILAVLGRGHLPILVGGTGLWIRAVVRGFAFPEEQASGLLRDRVQALGSRRGWDAVRRQVRMVDLETYRKVAPADRRRLSRALEVWWGSGRRIRRSAGTSGYRVSYWVLFRPVARLHARIGARTDQMMAEGLSKEVGDLLSQGVPATAQSLTAIGYREMVDWYYGRLSDREVPLLIRRHSEQLAKRQMTWFRGEEDVHWLDLEAYGEERALSTMERAARRLLTSE